MIGFGRALWVLAGASIGLAPLGCARGLDDTETAGSGGGGGEAACKPGTSTCDDGHATWCRPDGTLDEYACDPAQGLTCADGGCLGQCAHETLGASYIGCDYYPTQSLNPVWNGFHFAVAVANTKPTPAHVWVTRGAEALADLMVQPETVEVVSLPWVPDLKGGDFGPGGNIVDASGATRLVTGGAYRLRSDLPVTVYQSSALEYSLAEGGPGCPGASDGSGGCFSYSNDASLLLPVSALGRDYTAMAWHSIPVIAAGGPTAAVDSTGFIAVTATEDHTEIKLGAVGELQPGAGFDAAGKGSALLMAGDVLQITSAPGIAPTGFGASPKYGPDLSGTRVAASKPVLVMAGHRCAFIPTPSTGYCDHLEEAMFPIATLGRDYVVTGAAGPEVARWPYVLRVAATAAETTVHFDPPIAPDATIGPGQPPLEIAGLDSDVHISADHPVIIAQYMQGSTSMPSPTGEVPAEGDPSESLAVPIEQYRNETLFATSTTYDQNFVNLIAPAGAVVTLDGAVVPASEFAAVGSSGFEVARLALAKTDVHTVVSEAAIGIVVYGYGKYTSFMNPGGLDLKTINTEPLPEPK